MERLTAFEFIPATDGPQLVRLKCKDEVLLELNAWLWVGLAKLAFSFASREDLTIEGEGIGRPYWNDEQPAWTEVFNGADERRRIEAIRHAALATMQRGSILLM